ncbi:MAG: limonene-1,2-epoxide hydrolase [Rhodobiaceae bacterium]|nr:limonene-1,2-epoxide hydrolase [Rhodobiaceae bacterium]MBJ65589.1 limonene-1,2-epoxide hydrolase [Rhodobiaceae bacterium]|tara:strand:+ start:423 stop:803 length:381 start_codon:yes stop_codon:yes gene_type:complete
MSNQQKVVDFINHWNNRDIEGIMSSLSEDCFYHNIPMDPQNGKEEIRASLEPFVQMATNIEWIIHQIAENEDGAVLTERTDRFEINGQWMDILVMGVMEFQDGLISNWRDYFDMKAYEAETARVLG